MEITTEDGATVLTDTRAIPILVMDAKVPLLSYILLLLVVINLFLSSFASLSYTND